MRSSFDDLKKEIKEEFPKFEIIEKGKSRLHRFIDKFLKVITFGKQDRYLKSYVTTMGQKVYVPDGWHDSRSDERKMITMRHERVHMRQFRRYFYVLFSFLYLFFPVPVFLAYFRARFEKEAYEETLWSASEILGVKHIEKESVRENIIGQFTTAAYFWMWPFRRSLEKWYDRTVSRIKDAKHKSE